MIDFNKITEELDDLLPIFNEIRKNSSAYDDIEVADEIIASIYHIKNNLKTGNLSGARKEWFVVYRKVTESYVWHDALTDTWNSVVKKLRKHDFMDF